MYSTSTEFAEIKPVCPALLSFAVQKVKDKLVREAKDAVLPSSGLHATTSDSSTRRANWVDIGATTIPDMANFLKTKQPHLPQEYRCGILAFRHPSQDHQIPWK